MVLILLQSFLLALSALTLLEGLQEEHLFSGMPLMECSHVDHTSPENTFVGLPPSWMDTAVCRLYISINPPQPGGIRGPSRSPPVSWWLELRSDSSVMILPGIWTCQMAKEVEPSCFNDTWNWKAACYLPDRSVGNVSSIRDPKDFSERPCVKGIQSLSKRAFEHLAP